MKQLNKRDATAMAGAAWYHHEKWGSVKVSAAADVLDNSNGWVGGNVSVSPNADGQADADAGDWRALL